MQIYNIRNAQNSENCYIVANGERAFVIDPGSGADEIMKKAAECGVKIEGILLTHCHYDHMSGLEDLRKMTGAPLYATAECGENIQSVRTNVSALFGDPITAAAPERTVCDGEEISVAGMCVKCIKTPGHTSCCTCFLVGNSLFSGDTLFLRSVGRWDLPTGDRGMLEESIQKTLYRLSDGTEVYPGHGAKTSIGYEKKFNLEIRGDGTGAW